MNASTMQSTPSPPLGGLQRLPPIHGHVNVSSESPPSSFRSPFFHRITHSQAHANSIDTAHNQAMLQAKYAVLLARDTHIPDSASVTASASTSTNPSPTLHDRTLSVGASPSIAPLSVQHQHLVDQMSTAIARIRLRSSGITIDFFFLYLTFQQQLDDFLSSCQSGFFGATSSRCK